MTAKKPDSLTPLLSGTPRPTSPPRRQKYHPVARAALINGFCLVLRRIIADFRSVGLSDAEIERMFRAQMVDTWAEATE